MLKNRAIILAAGSSTRMGSQKMLLPFGESTILETVIQNIHSSSVDSILVVLGADHEQILEFIKPLPVEVCINTNHQSGMLSSVVCGFSALPDDTSTALIFLGDQPGISPAVTDAVIRAYNESLHGIVVPVSNHRRGHPLLVDFKYKREIGIGLIFILGLALFIWGFNFLKGFNLFKEQRVLYAVYDQVGGLNQANPVSING